MNAQATITAAPFLNDHKRQFLYKRLLQTFFGGIILKSDNDYDSLPWFIYVSQFSLFIMPFLFGGISILVNDLTRFTDSRNIALFAGCLYFLIIVLLKTLALVLFNNAYLRQLKAKLRADSKLPSLHYSKKNQSNLLMNEESYVFNSCFSILTFSFVFQPIGCYVTLNSLNNPPTIKIDKQKFFIYVLRILLDAILCGFIMFSSVKFESLIYLNSIYSLVGAIFIFIFNWFVLCIGFYSLSVREPYEPNIFQPYDTYKVQHYNRSFYIICFQIIECIYVFASQPIIPTLAIFWLKILFIFLPFGWFFGSLPSIECFILWFLEQCYIHIYGGSGSASNLRLVIQLLLAVVVSLIYFASNDIAIIIILAGFGYILSSLDLIYLSEYFIKWVKIKRSIKSSVVPLANNEPKLDESTSFHSILSLKDWLYHLVMFSLTIACSIIPFAVLSNSNSSLSSKFQIERNLLFIAIGLFVLCKLLSDLQGVYLCFSLVRNPFYPKNCLSQSSHSKRSINEKKIFFKILKYLRILLIRVIAPLLLCAVVSIDCSINKTYQDESLTYWRIICILRAFRWIWTSTFLCLFEMSITNIVLLAIVYNNVNDDDIQTQANLIRYFLTGCLAASFLRDRIIQSIRKCFAFFLLTITSWTIKKQRRKSSLIVMVLNFLIFPPILLPMIVIASVISSPLLPLFTFPIFLISFPRMKKFWPQKANFFSWSILSNVKNESNQKIKTSKINIDDIKMNQKSQNLTGDSSFYAQLQPHLIESLKELILTGSIGSSLQPDTYFLSRFQDRIIWIQILEASSSYYIVNMKGLELQETSCHTREAQYIDDSFDLAFENPQGANANAEKQKILKFNPNPFNCMTQKDILVFEAYSDANNSLVGIIDNPESLKLISSMYPKVLHYFIIKHLIELNKKVEEDSSYNISALGKLNKSNLEVFSNSQVLNSQPININTTSTSLEDEHKHQSSSLGNYDKKGDNGIKPDSAIRVKSKENENIHERKSLNANEDVNDFSDSDNWSDNGSVDMNIVNKRTKKSANVNKKDDDNNSTFDFDINAILGLQKPKKDESHEMNFLKRSEEDFIAKNNSKTSIENEKVKKFESKVMPNFNKNTLTSDVQAPSSPISLPSQWLNFLNENLNITRSLDNQALKTTISSKQWLEKLFECYESLNNESNKIKFNSKNLLSDYETDIWTSHYKFLLKCSETLGLNESSSINSTLNPQSIAKFFKGELPYSMANEKLAKEHPNLSQLLIKSFRYTIKMMLDHVTLCPIETDSEFFESIKSYEEDWYIGSESDTEFAQNILKNKPFIFSIYKDLNKKTVNSRTLSLQQIKSPIAELNNEIVKSIWSSTNLELLYMTNDDDERYSIQAHPYVLRNITIQSSDAPLGYCVYNSENIYLSIANPF